MAPTKTVCHSREEQRLDYKRLDAAYFVISTVQRMLESSGRTDSPLIPPPSRATHWPTAAFLLCDMELCWGHLPVNDQMSNCFKAKFL